MNSKNFRFKPIETRYKGYHFRSRLEARWAVFFDELGIEYQYEPEGYGLGGIPYLPDFWLPEQKYFFEVKGEDPTEDELEKAKRLALYAQKIVYIAAGSISLPPDDLCNEIIAVVPPALMKVKKLYDGEGKVVEARYQYPDVAPEILLLLQRLSEAEIKPLILNDELTLLQEDMWWEGRGTLGAFIQQIRQQATILEQIAPMFQKHQQELAEIIATDSGWENQFNRQLVLDNGQQWAECSECEELDLVSVDFPHTECPKGKGKWSSQSPRLIAAYRSAREARF